MRADAGTGRSGPPLPARGAPLLEPVLNPQLASVAVGRPVRGEFTYRIPPGREGLLLPGQRLKVPFGRGLALGFYLGPAAEPAEGVRLKSIAEVLDEAPPLSAGDTVGASANNVLLLPTPAPRGIFRPGASTGF